MLFLFIFTPVICKAITLATGIIIYTRLTRWGNSGLLVDYYFISLTLNSRHRNINFNNRNMAKLTAATKAELALVLPSLLVVSHLERNGTLPSGWLPLSKTYRRSAHLGNGASVQLTSPDGEGKVWSDRAIIEHLVVSKSKAPSLRSALVSAYFSSGLASLVLIIVSRLGRRMGTA